MFQFPAFAFRLERNGTIFSYRVAPFGNPRIDSYLPIPTAYRSLSRPSSPSRAQASPMCPYVLYFLFICAVRTSHPHIARTSVAGLDKYLAFVTCYFLALFTSVPSCQRPSRPGANAAAWLSDSESNRFSSERLSTFPSPAGLSNLKNVPVSLKTDPPALRRRPHTHWWRITDSNR